MYIKKVHIKRFKKFKDLDLSFEKGLNIIKGPNERGKSSLVAALVAGLFYDSRKSNNAIKAHRSWGEEKLYEMILHINHKDDEYVLQKDFENKHLLLKNVSKQTHQDTYSGLLTELDAMMGITTDSLYKLIACFGQSEINEINSVKKERKKELDIALQNIITSGADSISAVELLNKFKKAIVNLKKGIDRPTVTPGPIRALQDNVEEKKSRMSVLKENVDRVVKDKGESKEFFEKKQVLQKKIEGKTRLFEENKKIYSLDERKVVLEKSLDAVISKQSQVETLEKTRSQYMAQTEQYAFLKDKDLHAIERKLIEFSARKKSIDQEQALQKEAPSSKKLYYGIAAVFAVVGVGGVFMHPYLYGSFVVAIAVLIYSVVSKDSIDLNSDADEKNTLLHAEEGLLREVKSVTYDDFLEKKQAYQSALVAVEKVNAGIAGVMGSVSAKELESDKIRISKDLAVLEAGYDNLGLEKKLSPEIFHALEGEIVSLTEELVVVNQGLARSETRVDLAGDEVEELTKLEEEVPYLEEKLAAEKKRLSVFEQSFLGLIEAKNEIAASAKTILTQDMNEHLPFVTDGRYSEVEVDDDLVFYVKNEHGDVIRPEEYLSRGTIDQFYLIARFSLVKMISGNKRPPLILDDPLITFDNERKQRSMELIKKFSKDFQIFFMTYSDEYDEWGNVIEI